MVRLCRRLLGLLTVIATANGNGETPVQKVIGLLGKLSTHVEADGQRDAKLYDKYACFCKEEADNKLYAIESSTKLIGTLDATMKSLDAEINDLNTAIGKLTGEISTLESDIKTAGETRDTEHQKYLGVAERMIFAIESVQKAVEAMKASKGMMTYADLDLVQLKAAAALVPEASLKLDSLLQAAVHQPGQPDRYQYQGNDIIAILKELEKKFISYKNDLDTEEFNANADYDKNVLNMQNIKKFKSAEKAEKEATVEKKSEELATATDNKSEEEADKKADGEFMSVLQDECETKATQFDQRSQMRAAELTALAGAIKALKEGAAPNWKANKKLVGLTKSVKVTKKIVNMAHAATKKVAVHSFLQMRSQHHREEKDTQVVRKALHVIQGAAGRLHSAVLSAATLKVTVSIDHFVKVRQLIKDLVEKLEADAAAEASTKSYCDTKMSEAMTKRDTKHAEVEDLKAQLAVAAGKEAQLKSEIGSLSQGIADNAKAMKEMTELWTVASADNTLTLAEAEAAIEAVKSAISILDTFYNNAGAFIQNGKYVPTNSSRTGMTVADVAPEITEGTYHGEQDSSKGIIGMLNVILSDFERTKTAVTQKNTDEEGSYNTEKGSNEADTSAKETSKDTKSGELTATENQIISLKDDLKDAQDLLANAEKSLADLKSMCVDGENYADRKANRLQEIEALKEALSILDNWKR